MVAVTWSQRVSGWWLAVVGWLAVWLARAESKAHQGGRVIVPGGAALVFQPALAAVIGVNEAIIVQKVHEWLQYNQAGGKHLVDGQHWTYNSYAEWQRNHFPWLSVDSVGRLFRKLEKAGVLVGDQKRQKRGDNRKWHTINYAAIEGLLKCQEAGVKMPSTPGQDAFTPGQNASKGRQNATNNNNNKINIKAQSVTQESENNNNNSNRAAADAAVFHQPEEGIDESYNGDYDDILQSAESQVYDPPGTRADAIEVSVTPDETQDATPPSSAPPPSPLVAAMVERLPGLTAGYAEGLIARHGEAQVRAVYLYAWHNRARLVNPVGWVTDELRADRLKLPPVEVDTVAAGTVASGKYADFIDS